jgi:hypothetical protein
VGFLLGNVGNILRNSSGTPWEPDGNTLGTHPKPKNKIKIPSPLPLLPPRKKLLR